MIAVTPSNIYLIVLFGRVDLRLFKNLLVLIIDDEFASHPVIDFVTSLAVYVQPIFVVIAGSAPLESDDELGS